MPWWRQKSRGAHLDLETEERQEVGQFPEQARNAARRSFGNTTQMTESPVYPNVYLDAENPKERRMVFAVLHETLGRGFKRIVKYMLAGSGRPIDGIVLVLIVAMAATVTCTNAQSSDAGPGRLPDPTGDFGVGRVIVTWTDASRVEPLSPTSGARKLAVDIWYPANSTSGVPADYLDLAGFERAFGAEALQKRLRGAYNAIKAGVVRPHALNGAPFAQSIKRSPVLIFSPGAGMARELYAAQLEDLASHGYVVAAISHPYDAFAVVFPDGTDIVYSNKRWPAQPSFEGKANLNQLEWHADDIRFVLDQLNRSNESVAPSLPFAGHLDLGRVGAFGHSFGGVAVAYACQGDRRIKACLNQDGENGLTPFYLDARGRGIDQPFMFIERALRTTPATDDELAEMKVTRDWGNEIFARLKAYRDRVLRSTGTTYHIILQSSTTTHMDFSDLPILSASTVTEADTHMRIMAVVRDYTRAFFDRYLKEARATLLDEKASSQFVEAVERFGPAKEPNKHR
jgi:pimeloyl-ACP methyl ester carboxylesterase